MPVSTASAAGAEQGPVLFPPLEGSGTLSEGQERDGSERLIAYGLRLLSRPDGALEQAREYLPAARGAQAVELPARLGGGFLFYVLASNATLFFRSPTFTGELEPFARLDFEAEQVSAGFDRLYVSSRRPDRLIALDAERGTGLGLGSLPRSPGYGKMLFADAWFGAVQVPLRGTLVTFDAGGSWRPLSTSAPSLAVQDGELTLSGPDGIQALDANGAFSRRDEPGAGGGTRENEVAQALRAALQPTEVARGARALSGLNALKLAVLRGFRDHDTLVVASSGRLIRIRASDGALVDTVDHAYAGGGQCNALHYGQGFGFACADEGRQTTLYAFSAPLALRPVRVFSGARYVSASGNGALVIRGGCTGGADVAGAYCIADQRGGFREIRVRGDFGVERVAALADGRVAVIVPPRLGGSGFLSVIDRAGKEQRFALKLPDAALGSALLEKGLWLDGFVERPSGGLSGWVVGSEPFAGVLVTLDGTVTVGAEQSSIDRALLSGSHGLLVGRTGRALETIDGGLQWSDVDLPSEFDGGRELRDDARMQGCSEVGCAFAGFLRVGWKSGSAAPRLDVAGLPDYTPLPQPGGSRWLVHCEATGEASEPASPVSPRAPGPGRPDDGATAPWASFFELPAPALAAGEAGFDAAASDSESAALRAYVWGERGADWTRAGHFQVRALDRFDVSRGAFQSAVSRSPWSDATSAAEAFGFDGTGTPTSWRAVLDAGQRSAAVLTSARGLLDLLLFEAGKTVTHIPNAGRLGLGMLNSVAKLSDAWYAGSFNENRAFTLTRISGSRVDRLAEYPDAARDQGSLALVRGAHADELAIWVIARGWYLFPLDPKTFAAQAPLYKSPAELAEMPPPCEPTADGFLLDGAPTLEPSLRFPKGFDELAAHHVEAQFVWSATGLCTRALAADTELTIKRGALNAMPGAAPPNSVPLTLSERRPQGRRWGYACSR